MVIGSLGKPREMIALTLFVAFCIVLFWHYGGNPGDIYLYTNAGFKIVNQVDPYLDSEYANSPIAAVISYFLSLLVSAWIFPILIQLVNVLGLVTFVNYLKNQSWNHEGFAFLYLLIPFTIPFRALISNVQVTGLVLGLYVLSQKCVKSNNKVKSYLGFLAIILALEIKPQLALPFALIIFWNKKSYFVKFMSIVTFLMSHLVLSAHFNSSLEILWFKKMMVFSNKSLKDGPEISIWKALSVITNNPGIVKFLALLALIAYYIVMLISIQKFREHSLLIAQIAPLIGSYSHMYDFVGLTVFAFLYLNRSSNLKFLVIIALILPAIQNEVIISVTMLLLYFSIVYIGKKNSFIYLTKNAIWLMIILATNALPVFLGHGLAERELSIRMLLVSVSVSIYSLFVYLSRIRRLTK